MFEKPELVGEINTESFEKLLPKESLEPLEEQYLSKQKVTWAALVLDVVAFIYFQFWNLKWAAWSAVHSTDIHGPRCEQCCCDSGCLWKTERQQHVFVSSGWADDLRWPCPGASKGEVEGREGADERGRLLRQYCGLRHHSGKNSANKVKWHWWPDRTPLELFV